MPAAEEELLLTDTQQAGHQRIQCLKESREMPHNQILLPFHFKTHQIGQFSKHFSSHNVLKLYNLFSKKYMETFAFLSFLNMNSLLKTGMRKDHHYITEGLCYLSPISVSVAQKE